MPMVAFSVREDAKANNFSATETETALTLQGHQPSPQSHHAQIFIAVQEPVAFHRKQDPISGSVSPALGVTTEGMGVMENSTVRRLTPTECERLQGFPDGWTGERFDEKKQAVIAQADSNRYKQMGNAVAVPVVDWLIKRLVANT